MVIVTKMFSDILHNFWPRWNG